jgi:cell division septal protein FtsQ
VTPTDVATRPPPVDPRFRARRIAVRRGAGRRRLRRLLILGVGLIVLVAAWGLTRSAALDVDGMTVDGAHRTSGAAIREAVAAPRGMPMLDVDVDAATARLERLPWVATARVSRHWPGTVAVEIDEREALVALAAPGGAWALADAGGRILASVDKPPEGLLVLDGVRATAAPGGELGPQASSSLRVARSLPASLRSRVSAVATGEGSLQLRLAPGGVVELGSADDLTEKLLAATTVLTDADPADLAVLDVRVPASPVLTHRG